MLTLNIIKIGSINTNPKIKFIKLAKTLATGINSRGRLNCFNKGAWLINDEVASDKDTEKKNQGRIPARQNKGKLSISVLITFVKIKLIAPIIAKGRIIAHHIPSLEPEYLAFSCLTESAQRRCLF